MKLFKVLSQFLNGGLPRIPEIEISVHEGDDNPLYEYKLVYLSKDIHKNEIRFNRFNRDDPYEARSRIFYWDRKYSDSDFLKRLKVTKVDIERTLNEPILKISVVDYNY